MSQDISLGQKFSNFDDFLTALQVFEEQTCTKYRIDDCRTVGNANKRIAPGQPRYRDDMKYSYAKYMCKHGGEYSTRSNGKRPNQRTFKMNCPCSFFLRADRKLDCLIISTATFEHNHPVDRSTYLMYPEMRRLDEKQTEIGRLMYKMCVPPKAFRKSLMTISGKLLTSQDVNNLKIRFKEEETKGASDEVEETKGASDVVQLMETLDQILAEEPTASIQLTVDNDGKITTLFLQLPSMKQALQKFPEVILLDATYRVNSTKMPLFTLLVEDGHSCSIPISHFFVANESLETLDDGFSALEKSVGSTLLELNEFFFVYKDFTEIAVVKKYFPKCAIHLCLFHVFETFKLETGSLPHKSGKKNEILLLFEKLAYATTEAIYEKHFSELQEKASPKLLQYYTKNWHDCREMWVSAWRKKAVAFGNGTTNCLESFHENIDTVMNSSKSLSLCVSALAGFCQGKKTMQSSISNNSKNNSKNTKAIYSCCTPYAAKMVCEQLEKGKELHKDYVCQTCDGGFSIRLMTEKDPDCTVNKEMTSCSCPFASTMLMPCKHIFFARGQGDPSVSIFEETLIDDQWKKAYQLFESTTASIDVSSGSRSVTVLTKRKHNNSEKYNKAFRVCRDLASDMAKHGQATFNDYLREIDVLRNLVRVGSKFKVVELKGEESA